MVSCVDYTGVKGKWMPVADEAICRDILGSGTKDSRRRTGREMEEGGLEREEGRGL